MFVRWAYTPSPCLPVDTTKVGKTAVAGCGLVSARANLCALVRTQADFMQTSGSGKTQKRERKSIQKKRDNSKQTHDTAIGIIGTYDREATGSVIRHRQNTGPHRTKRIPTRHDARQAIGISPIPEPATDKMQGKLQRQGRMAEEADKRQIPNGVLLQKETAASRRTKISAYRTERNETVRYSHGESGENIQRKKKSSAKDSASN